MAVAVTNSYNSNAFGNGQVSIPNVDLTDADMAVVCATGYNSSGIDFDELSWDGLGGTTDWTMITDAPVGDPSCPTYYQLSSAGDWPGSASGKTFYFSVNNAPASNDSLCVLFALSGVDVTSPIIGSDVDTGTQDWTSNDLGVVGAGDMAIICAAGYSAALDIEVDGQTAIYEGSEGTARIGVGYELEEDQTVVDYNGNYFAGVAFAIAASAGVTDLSINVAETLAFSETMGEKLPLGPISEADTMTIGELAKMMLGSHIKAADTITFAEVVSASLGINVSESDTITLAEVLTILKDIIPNLADTFGITESLTVSGLFFDLFIDLADTFGITSALAVLKDIVPILADTFGIVEVLNILKDILPSLADTFGISEVLILLKDIMPSLADTFGIDEVLTVVAMSGIFATLANTFGIDEDLTILFDSLFITLANTFGVNETLVILKDIMPSMVDTFGISEVLTMLKDAMPSLVDKFGINEFLTVYGLGTLWTNIILEGVNTMDGKFYQIVGRYKER